MKTNKLPNAAWSDAEAAGSQAPHTEQLPTYQMNNDEAILARNIDRASNDASYDHVSCNDEYAESLIQDLPQHNMFFGYKSVKKTMVGSPKPSDIDITDESNDIDITDINNSNDSNDFSDSAIKANSVNSSVFEEFEQSLVKPSKCLPPKNTASIVEIPERIFMNGLIKHTGIALAIIIPLAAFSAYAATPPITATADRAATVTTDRMATETLSIKPSDIIHKSASTPTTVDSVDLKKYAGTWYEIGRLPMYFQRNCASDVTATYTEKTDGSGIIVTNKCVEQDGSGIVADGLAKPVDSTGSKLKVTFLPSWIRWLPVGRADYWVLARDADYKTALVGTPDKKYLWLLARSPNVSQETYGKYRQIAQQQGYNLKEFKLTPQSKQTVSLYP